MCVDAVAGFVKHIIKFRNLSRFIVVHNDSKFVASTNQNIRINNIFIGYSVGTYTSSKSRDIVSVYISYTTPYIEYNIEYSTLLNDPSNVFAYYISYKLHGNTIKRIIYSFKWNGVLNYVTIVKYRNYARSNYYRDESSVTYYYDGYPTSYYWLYDINKIIRINDMKLYALPFKLMHMLKTRKIAV